MTEPQVLKQDASELVLRALAETLPKSIKLWGPEQVGFSTFDVWCNDGTRTGQRVAYLVYGANDGHYYHCFDVTDMTENELRRAFRNALESFQRWLAMWVFV